MEKFAFPVVREDTSQIINSMLPEANEQVKKKKIRNYSTEIINASFSGNLSHGLIELAGFFSLFNL